MKVYSVEDVARILNISIYTVKNYIKDGRIKTMNMGVIRISEKALDDFIRGE